MKSPGKRIRLTGVEIEVAKVTPGGLPTETVYRFDSPLEDPSLIWREIRQWRFRPFKLPAVGETIELRP